jgi:ubiquitin carboxyl-terminal hydrolase 4/11/15
MRNPIYHLVGYVNHSGSIDFGHYTATCKNPLNGKWYTFNDSHVTETYQKDNVESSSPYLLFYSKEGITGGKD